LQKKNGGWRLEHTEAGQQQTLDHTAVSTSLSEVIHHSTQSMHLNSTGATNTLNTVARI